MELPRLWLFEELKKGLTLAQSVNNIRRFYNVQVCESNIFYWYRVFRRNAGLQNITLLQMERLRNAIGKQPTITVWQLARQLQISYLIAQKYIKNFTGRREAALPSTDEDEENLEDDDACTTFELEQHFQLKYLISDETVVSLKKDYVLSLCQNATYTRLAAGLSNGEVQIFDISGERHLSRANMACIAPPVEERKDYPVNICGLHFLDDGNNNALLIGTTNGLVRLYDLRTQRVEARFKEDGVNTRMITCFGCNANGRVLCTGTEQYEHTVNMLFYDIREPKPLGAYFESHQDDITSLRFHPRNPDLLCSGSTDGLVNVFDIKEVTEDDALLLTVNTDSSVHKVNWHKNIYDKNVLSCITHTNDFISFECENFEVLPSINRSVITSSMKRKNPANCNLVNVHNMEDDGVFLLAGTNYNKGKILRSLRFQNRQLFPLADFAGNKQIVRESVFNPKNQTLITAGESGIVTIWVPDILRQQGHTTTDCNKLKSKTKLKSNKTNPY